MKQAEFSPVSVPAQIILLLASSAGLLDGVPLDQMKDAEKALAEAAATLPAAVCERFDTAATLSDEDRAKISECARGALTRFAPEPEAAEPVEGKP